MIVNHRHCGKGSFQVNCKINEFKSVTWISKVMSKLEMLIKDGEINKEKKRTLKWFVARIFRGKFY